MINISKSGNAIKFAFTDSDHYLYGNGEIECPVNSLSLIVDESNMVTMKKANSNDIFLSFDPANSNLSDKAGVINFYKTEMVGSTGGGSESGITSGDVQTMIDNSLEDYYDKDEVDAGFDEVDAALSGKADASDVTEEISAAVSGKADTSAVTAVENDVLVLQDALAGKANTAALTAHTSDTGIHVSQVEKNAWNAKAEPYSAGTGIDITDNVISATGGGVTVDPTLDSGSTNPVANSAITTALDGKQDALQYYSESTEEGYADIYVRNDDGEGNVDEYSFNVGAGSVDLGHYNQYDDGQGNSGYTSTNIQFNNPEINLISESEENGETEATNLKITPTGVTINDEDVITESRLADYQPVLSAGTGIEISGNVISATGGGGATYSAGTNISIDTANTINCTLNLRNGTGTNSLLGTGANKSTKLNSFAFGENASANGVGAISLGSQSGAEGNYSFVGGGVYVTAKNLCEAAFGTHNKSVTGSTTSGQTLFSVGNGASSAAKHNAFEIRKNGDIYITSGGTDIKLQDNLGGGGGGGSVTVDSTLDMNSSNPVENQAIAQAFDDTNAAIDVKADQSELYELLGGSNDEMNPVTPIRLLRISQSDYDDLANGDGYDPDTLYIITPDEE